ncbi:MAG: nucleotide-binding protein [Nitrososphaera sp.]|nr:nucleotide-binding protein [Nitrososphaera sp.]
MATVKIFIASSTGAMKEAQTLATELTAVQSEMEFNTICWWAPKDYSHILTNLIRQTNECDFSVILLTKDDLVSVKDNTALKARDNCIFEAGLFTGALGPAPDRCFLLVSVHPRDLPSDLAGLRYIDIYQYDDGVEKHSKEKVDNKLKEAAQKIGAAIGATRPLRANRGLKLPIVTGRELMELETMTPKGNLQERSSNVFVSSPQPLEVDEHFATRVITNMVDGHTGYRYVFEAHERSAEMIADVIGSLVEVNKVPSRKDKNSCIDRTPQENLETMRRYLRIHFLPDMPGLHYCVHNANQFYHAICYLRTPGTSAEGEIQFVEWCRGNEALLVAHEINRMCKEPEGDKNRVFNSTVHYMLYDSANFAFRFALLGEIKKRLPSIEEERVKEVFGL